jgi:hypothetical protein
MADKRERGQDRRDAGHGSVFYDESKGRWIGQLPRDEFGRRPKVSGRQSRRRRASCTTSSASASKGSCRLGA